MEGFCGDASCVHKDVCKLPICQRGACEHMLKPLSSSRMLDDVRALLTMIDAVVDDVQTGTKPLFVAITGAKMLAAAEKVRAHVG